MANFLRKFVKSKSRSKSPIKHYYHHLPTDFVSNISSEQCGNSNNWVDPYEILAHHSPDCAPTIKTKESRNKFFKTTKNNADNNYQNRGDFYNNKDQMSPVNENFYKIIHQHRSRKDDEKNICLKNNLDNRKSKLPNRKRSPSIKTTKPPKSRSQYYFTPDYKSTFYDDIHDQQTKPQLDLYSLPYSQRHSPNNTFNFEGEPSLCNTLSPAWQNNHCAFCKSPSQTHCSLTPNVSAPENIDHLMIKCFNGGNWVDTKLSPSALGSVGDLYSTAMTSANFDMNVYNTMKASSPNFYSLQSVRPRSVSPKKAMKSEIMEKKKHRSKSPTKRSSTRSFVTKTVDYLAPQCKLEGCSASIIIENTQFLICKHQFSHASDFFRILFLNNRALPIEGVKQKSINEYVIVVSGLKHPSQSVQFQWFIESTIPCPILKSITENSLETCMRLSKRFAAKGLEMRCAKFIHENVDKKPPMMALCWLNWAFKHRFDRFTHDVCLPVVARLPLLVIEKHRKMLPEKIVADLIAMKLRTCYQQAAEVFYTIHKMGHFYVEMLQCPRCGRQREQGKIHIQSNPCQRLIGCERCLHEFGCKIERKSSGDYEAFHQCKHGLWPFNDRTEDCHCQTPIYRANFCIQDAMQVIDGKRSVSLRAGGDGGRGATTPAFVTLDSAKRQGENSNDFLTQTKNSQQNLASRQLTLGMTMEEANTKAAFSDSISN